MNINHGDYDEYVEALAPTQAAESVDPPTEVAAFHQAQPQKTPAGWSQEEPAVV